MKVIAPFYKGAHDCDTIKRIAFDSHVDCYIKTGVGFCKMAADASNWDALWAVYEMKDFAGPDSAAAWKQVTVTVYIYIYIYIYICFIFQTINQCVYINIINTLIKNSIVDNNTKLRCTGAAVSTYSTSR